MTGEAAERAKVRGHAVSVVVPSGSCRVAKGLLFVGAVGAWRTNVRGLRRFDGCLLCGEKVQVLSSGVPRVTGHRSGDDQRISQTPSPVPCGGFELELPRRGDGSILTPTSTLIC